MSVNQDSVPWVVTLECLCEEMGFPPMGDGNYANTYRATVGGAAAALGFTKLIRSYDRKVLYVYRVFGAPDRRSKLCTFTSASFEAPFDHALTGTGDAEADEYQQNLDL